jgi:hypothetical protein
MKLRLWEQKFTRIVVSITALAALIAMATVSCTKKNDVLVTEIGVSPPRRPVSKPSKAADFTSKVSISISKEILKVRSLLLPDRLI